MSSSAVSIDPPQRFSGRALFRRQVVASLCATSLWMQMGCYNAVPVAGASSMPLGEVTVNFNDRGRLLVGNRLGPLVDHVTGRIVRADSMELEVAVEFAEDVRGNIARWGGERFTIPREGVNTIAEKKLAKKRTFLTVASILTGIVVVFFTARHGGRGTGKNPDGGDGPPI